MQLHIDMFVFVRSLTFLEQVEGPEASTETRPLDL
jgi:hypothetical protein